MDAAALQAAHVSRRRFIGGLGAAAAVGTAATLGGASPALASPSHHHHARHVFSNRPAPNPIEQTVDGGAAAPFDLIHWLLPGPDGATTQILELPAFGLEVDPSTVGDYNGFTTYAVVAGTAEDRMGNPYDVELDVRVMDGQYMVDGKRYFGTFGFF